MKTYRDTVARIALALQRAGGDHLGDVVSLHRDFLAILHDGPFKPVDPPMPPPGRDDKA